VGGERTSGPFRQAFVGFTGMLAMPIRLQNLHLPGHMISTFKTRTRMELQTTRPGQSQAYGTNNTQPFLADHRCCRMVAQTLYMIISGLSERGGDRRKKGLVALNIVA